MQIIPNRVKIGLCLVTSLVIAPAVLPNISPHLSLAMLVPAVVGELLIGMTIGLAVSLVFMGLRLTGAIIGQQAGIALAQVVDPTFNDQTSIVSQLYFLVAMTVFVTIGGHRAVVGVFLDSFSRVAPGQNRIDESTLQTIVDLSQDAFILAIRLSAPALTALFCATLVMAFIARTIPQINILSVGFSVRIFVGLGVAALALPLAFELLSDSMMSTIRAVSGLLG